MSSNDLCTLRIGLLGPFYLEVDGVEIETSAWKSKKALTMLKYLAARHGQKVSSDVLIELLWPDNGNIDSTSNLHTAVWFVRRILAPQRNPETESRLRYSNGLYWLDLSGDGCIDRDKFEAHAKTARQLETTDPQTALFHCESALKLYRDDFLCEEMYDEWTLNYREDYKELYFELIQRTAGLLHRHRGDFKGAAKICRDALRRDPYREELYQAGIEALIGDKRYGDAVNLYKQCKQTLMEEFQLTPSPITQKLILEMKQNLTEETVTQTLDIEVEQSSGAYTCDRTMFQTILNMEQRRLRRNERHFSIGVVSKKDSSSRQFANVFHVLQRSLRSSDVICQWSPEIIIMLLPETNVAGAEAVYDRLQQLLHTSRADSSTFMYDVLDSNFLENMQETLRSTLSS